MIKASAGRSELSSFFPLCEFVVVSTFRNPAETVIYHMCAEEFIELVEGDIRGTAVYTALYKQTGL